MDYRRMWVSEKTTKSYEREIREYQTGIPIVWPDKRRM
jgi:hypothetical protein